MKFRSENQACYLLTCGTIINSIYWHEGLFMMGSYHDIHCFSLLIVVLFHEECVHILVCVYSSACTCACVCFISSKYTKRMRRNIYTLNWRTWLSSTYVPSTFQCPILYHEWWNLKLKLNLLDSFATWFLGEIMFDPSDVLT